MKDELDLVTPGGIRYTVKGHIVIGGPFDGFNCSAVGVRHLHPDNDIPCKWQAAAYAAEEVAKHALSSAQRYSCKS